MLNRITCLSVLIHVCVFIKSKSYLQHIIPADKKLYHVSHMLLLEHSHYQEQVVSAVLVPSQMKIAKIFRGIFYIIFLNSGLFVSVYTHTLFTY